MSSTPSPQRSGPPTTTSAGGSTITSTNSQRVLIKRFIFASEWYFHPEGIKALMTPFQRDLDIKHLEAKVDWNREDATFRLSCPHLISDQVWDLFFKNVQHLIIQESGDWLDDENDSGSEWDESLEGSEGDELSTPTSNKIQRLSKWKNENGITATVGTGDINSASVRVEELNTFPEKIRSFKSRLVWNYDVANPLLEEVIPDNILSKVESIAGCGLSKDLNDSKIYVGSHSEEDGHRAICMLDNIRKAWSLKLPPAATHLFYTGGLENYQVLFKRLNTMKRNFFKTTLLDNMQVSTKRFNYGNLPLAVTVRCSTFNNDKTKYVPLKDEKFRAAVSLENKHSGLRDWHNFEYNYNIPRGREVHNSMTRFESYAEQYEKSLLHHLDQQASSLSKTTQPLEAPAQDSLHVEKTQLWVDGQEKPSLSSHSQSLSDDDFSNAGEILPKWDDYRPLTEEKISRIQNTPSFPSKKRHLPYQNPLRTPSIASDHLLTSKERDLPPASISIQQAPINILDEENSMLGVAVLQPIQIQTNLLPSSAHQPRQIIQPNDDMVTRIFHTTMNQKAPKPSQKSTQKNSKKNPFVGRLEQPASPSFRRLAPSPQSPPPVNDPTSQFVERIASDFEDLLKGLRVFQGDLRVQAEFGRILLKNVDRRRIVSQDLTFSLDPDESMAYLDHSDPWPVFTKLLTVLPADVSYLLEMKDNQENIIWEPETQHWDVIYEILCVDSRAGHKRQVFTIEIDGERFTTLVKVRRGLGAINVHGVKQTWDFRISVTGTEADENIDSFYNDFAMGLKDSLHIPKGLSIPMIFFEVPCAFEDLLVYGVRSRRISRHRSIHGDSSLNVSEVRELQMFDVQGDNCIIWKAVGCREPDTRLPAQGHKFFYVWHEISITCSQADRLFEQNKAIKLGEEAAWDLKKLADIQAIQSLYIPACEMLKHMDGVGFYNDNEIDLGVHSAHAASEADKDPAPYYYW